MNRAQFEHAIRAAAAVAGEHEVIVIGSQAVHAWTEKEIPTAAMRSVAADVALRQDSDGSKADLIDGSIGEASLFFRRPSASTRMAYRLRRPSCHAAGSNDSFGS